MQTKIGRQSNGRIRTTLPRGVARAIDLYDRETKHIQYRIIHWHDGAIALEVTIGPDVDPDAINSIAPLIQSSGQVQLELPIFQAEAWGLVDHQLDWPEAEEVTVSKDGSVRLFAPVVDWQPIYDVSEASIEDGHESTISKSGDTRSNIESAFPTALAKVFGFTDTGHRAEITFDCVGRTKVLVVTPTDRKREELRNSVSIHLGGPGKRQARFNAGRIAAELDVYDVLDERSVRIRWVDHDGEHLIGYVPMEGV